MAHGTVPQLVRLGDLDDSRRGPAPASGEDPVVGGPSDCDGRDGCVDGSGVSGEFGQSSGSGEFGESGDAGDCGESSHFVKFNEFGACGEFGETGQTDETG